MTLAKNMVPIVRQRAAAVEQAIDDVDDATLWCRLAPGVNPMGNLVLHLSGNLMKYIARGVGGREYERDRPFEFQATDVPRGTILARFSEATQAVIEVLEATDAATLEEPYEGSEFSGQDKQTVMLHSIEHLGYHAGQVTLLAKLASLADDASRASRPG